MTTQPRELLDVDQLLARLSLDNPTVAPSTWAVLRRAAEHVVIDDATAQATAAAFHVGDAVWNARIDDLFADRLESELPELAGVRRGFGGMGIHSDDSRKRAGARDVRLENRSR